MAAEPGAGGDRRAGAARARDRAHRRRGADTPGGAAGSVGRAGRAPRDRDALPPRSALTQGARDPQGRRLFESAESPGRDRRVGGERGPESAEILSRLQVGPGLWRMVEDGGGNLQNLHQPPPTFTTSLRMPKRSEERRVGKECRSRWLAYN